MFSSGGVIITEGRGTATIDQIGRAIIKVARAAQYSIYLRNVLIRIVCGWLGILANANTSAQCDGWKSKSEMSSYNDDESYYTITHSAYTHPPHYDLSLR